MTPRLETRGRTGNIARDFARLLSVLARRSKGVVARAVITSSTQTGITTTVDVDGLTVTFVAGAGRNYEIVSTLYATSTVAGDVMLGTITDGSNNAVALVRQAVPTANSAQCISLTSWVGPFATDTSVTRKVRLSRFTGTGTVSVVANVLLAPHITVVDYGVSE